MCKLCTSGQVADEFHYILVFKELFTFKHKYLDDKCCSEPYTIKFYELKTSMVMLQIKKKYVILLLNYTV